MQKMQLFLKASWPLRWESYQLCIMQLIDLTSSGCTCVPILEVEKGISVAPSVSIFGHYDPTSRPTCSLIMKYLITATQIGINPIKPSHMSIDYRDSTEQWKLTKILIYSRRTYCVKVCQRLVLSWRIVGLILIIKIQWIFFLLMTPDFFGHNSHFYS